uniref:S100/CaBP-9k-type calcium binding subdomain domain-containing protein n=1 Tax=Kryptolebias marmoratus TaxID=37003 RepID=A0A3Q2ZKS8_KRYMA
MESAIGVLVSQFEAYAGSDASSDTLSRDEFFLSSHTCGFLFYPQIAADPAALSFLEFWQLIGQLASKHGGFGQ